MRIQDSDIGKKILDGNMDIIMLAAGRTGRTGTSDGCHVIPTHIVSS